MGEEPSPHQQVEEALSFMPLGSAPLDQEPLLSVDLGTAHSAAVTGEQEDLNKEAGGGLCWPLGPQLRHPFSSFPLSSLTASGDCYTFGSNQHGQLGTNARRVSRAPCQVQGLQGIKIAMVACGDAFTVAIGAGD